MVVHSVTHGHSDSRTWCRHLGQTVIVHLGHRLIQMSPTGRDMFTSDMVPSVQDTDTDYLVTVYQLPARMTTCPCGMCLAGVYLKV